MTISDGEIRRNTAPQERPNLMKIPEQAPEQHPLPDKEHHPQVKHQPLLAGKRYIPQPTNMSEITLPHITESMVKTMARHTANIRESEWGRHQSWEAIRIDDGRIIHSYKRRKAAIQGDLVKAQRYIMRLMELRNHPEKETNKQSNKLYKQAATQTDKCVLNAPAIAKRIHTNAPPPERQPAKTACN